MFLIVVITIQGCVHESSDEFQHTFIHILLGVITKTDKCHPLVFLEVLTAETVYHLIPSPDNLVGVWYTTCKLDLFSLLGLQHLIEGSNIWYWCVGGGIVALSLDAL